MDLAGWLTVAATAAGIVTLAFAGPWLLRDQRRRQRGGGGASFSGLGSAFDAVWRPSAGEAHGDWEAQVEMPAPAPSPGDPGRISDGRIVLRVRD